MDSTAVLIREALARRRMSRQRLADEARISLSTLEKGLSGGRPFSLETLVRLEQALGAPLRAVAETPTAPPELGGYAREAAKWLEGDFLALRPSLEASDCVYAYAVRIFWDESQSCMAFAESQRLDAANAQTGVVSLPLSAGKVYLHTNAKGQMRMAILNHPQRSGEMYGLMLTLSADPALKPTAFPFVLAPLPSDAGFGRVGPGEEHFEPYSRMLTTAARDYVALIPPPATAPRA